MRKEFDRDRADATHDLVQTLRDWADDQQSDVTVEGWSEDYELEVRGLTEGEKDGAVVTANALAHRVSDDDRALRFTVEVREHGLRFHDVRYSDVTDSACISDQDAEFCQRLVDEVVERDLDWLSPEEVAFADALYDRLQMARDR